MRSSFLLASFTMILGSVAANAGPCDILEKAGNPCVAAHSVVRALYNNYEGSLYQVLRASPLATMDIGVLTPGGVADTLAQEKFCGDSDCMIIRIYDQTPMENHLDVAPGGGAAPDADVGVNASKEALLLDGSKVCLSEPHS